MSIVTVTTNKSRGFAFAVCVDDAEYLLTAKHIIYDSSRILVDGNRVNHKYSCTTSDIAILSMYKGLNTFTLSDTNDENQLISYNDITVQPVLEYPITINPGDSGQPMLNDQNKVIGMLIGKSSECSYIIPAELIKQVIQEYRQLSKIPKSLLKIKK